MTPHEEQVRERAKRLWQEAGEPEGRDEEFWHEAERQIREGDKPLRGRRPKDDRPDPPAPPRGRMWDDLK